MGVTISEATRERATALLLEAGFGELPEPQDRAEAATAYWSRVEGAMHFEEPEILRYCVPSYTGSAEDETARLAAVLMLQEEAEHHAWGFEEPGPPVGMDGPKRTLTLHIPRLMADADLSELGRWFGVGLASLVADHEDHDELHIEAHTGGPGGCPVCRDDGPLWVVDPYLSR